MKSQPTIRPVYGKTNLSPRAVGRLAVKRFGSVIGLNPRREQYYRELHANVWPGVLGRLKKAHVRNYSIYVAELKGKKYLFSYFEYTGRDIQKDMRAIAGDPETRRWWKETDPCQVQLPGRKPGANWTELEQVFLME